MTWLVLAASAAHAQIVATHPRLILDEDTLSALRQRANDDTPQWRRLKSYCDSFIGGTVHYPDESTYPNPPDIGQGYQGHGYWSALFAEGLCYQVMRGIDAGAATAYGDKAAEILAKASMPYPGPHAENPCTDSGYAIRTYGVVFGIGFDWAYDRMSPSLRSQVYSTANDWIDAFEEPGGCADFEYEHPQSNYFAGYFHAKAAIALGTWGDNPAASAQWDDWLSHQFGERVRPYYEANLAGGGWPEGYANYAPLAVFDMTLPVREVKTAAGIDLANDAAAPYAFASSNADFTMHFTWPSRRYFDDRDTNRSGGDPDHPPGTTNAFLFQHLLGMQDFLGRPHEAVMREYLAEVDAATGGFGDDDPWTAFLFVDPDGPTAPLASLPRSYYATGMEAVAARSDWSTDAAWMSFRAAPYVNNPSQGEEYFDQGSLALVRGDKPLLVNATGWIVHDPSGSQGEDHVYEDNYGSFVTGDPLSGNRQAYNVFYVRHMNGSNLAEPFGQDASSRSDGAATKVASFEDGGTYVALRADRIEDMYRRFDAGPAVASWSRQIVYLRPGRFVVYDRTTAGDAAYDQYLAFHFPANPVAGAAPSGETRLDVTYDGTYMGAMTVVEPSGAVVSTRALYPDLDPTKVWQAQVRPASAGASQRWWTVFDLSSSPAAVASATKANVTAGGAAGVVLAGTSGNEVVLSGTGAPGVPISGAITYAVPAAFTHNTLTELAPGAGYSVSVDAQGASNAITVTPGGGYTTSAQGTLVFIVAADGSVLPGDTVFSDGFDG
ncbi:MAG TPA: hypothetical protein VHC92_15005 [Rhodanobacteraceae bacterium]|nr:hypothetical protein [Rhodanobacteraceae bacterium]